MKLIVAVIGISLSLVLAVAAIQNADWISGIKAVTAGAATFALLKSLTPRKAKQLDDASQSAATTKRNRNLTVIGLCFGFGTPLVLLWLLKVFV